MEARVQTVTPIDRDVAARLVRSGVEGDVAEFREAVRQFIDGIEESGDREFAAELRRFSHLEKRSQSLSDQEPASAFKAVRDEDAEIPIGLSQVKTNVQMEHIILPKHVKQVVLEFIEEQESNELYIANNLAPRNKMMLMGPPGNGKTALTKAIANRMACPLYFVRYDALISAKQGETSKRLHEIFEFVKSHRCILFFDEVDAIGKERGDENEAGDIKRVVSTLLVQLDDIPPHVIVLGATNHPRMLDRAIWRRFHVRVLLPTPDTNGYVEYLDLTYKRYGHQPDLDLRVLALRLQPDNFAEVEVFVEDSVRTFVRMQGRATIEEAIQISIENWPRTRMKIPT